jgi:prevent-host-death family protein
MTEIIGYKIQNEYFFLLENIRSCVPFFLFDHIGLIRIVDQFYNPKMGVCLMIFDISEAKTNLSKLVNMAYHGKKVVIAKNNLPLVEMVPHKPEGKRTLGLLRGKLKVPDDIMAEDEEINEVFYGSDK